MVINNRIILSFFEENVIAERYLDILGLKLVSALTVMFFINVDPDIPTETFWFQQGSAVVYFENLDQIFVGLVQLNELH